MRARALAIPRAKSARVCFEDEWQPMRECSRRCANEHLRPCAKSAGERQEPAAPRLRIRQKTRPQPSSINCTCFARFGVDYRPRDIPRFPAGASSLLGKFAIFGRGGEITRQSYLVTFVYVQITSSVDRRALCRHIVIHWRSSVSSTKTQTGLAVRDLVHSGRSRVE